MKLVRVISLAALAALAACVSQPTKAPQKPTRPAPIVVPPPVPPAPADWRDMPLSDGSWSYRDEGAAPQAVFGVSGTAASFVLRCDRSRGFITLARLGITTGNTMTIRTSFEARSLPLSVEAGPLPYVYAQVAAGDPFLDGLALSRGRFTVLVPGTPLLVIPAWAEPTRLIEECRG